MYGWQLLCSHILIMFISALRPMFKKMLEEHSEHQKGAMSEELHL